MKRPSWTVTQTVGRNVERRLEELGNWPHARVVRESRSYGRLTPSTVSRAVRAANSDRPDGKNPDLRVAELISLARTLEVSPAWLVTPQFGDVMLPGVGSPIRKLRFKAWWSGRRGLDGQVLEESNDLLQALAQEIFDAYEWSLTDNSYIEFMRSKRTVEEHMVAMEAAARARDPNGVHKWAAHVREETANAVARRDR